MLPTGNCSYEIRRDGEVIAWEQSNFDPPRIVASRRSADGHNEHRLEAWLDAGHRVQRLFLSYSATLFTRKATYEVVDDNLRGRISGVAGTDEMVVRLGRFREVDPAGFLIFRALIISHVRERQNERWTGRVAVIDASTLAATSVKQTCARQKLSWYSWTYEPRLGDREEIELDEAGRVRWCHDNRGTTAKLVSGITRC
jgi:hypothetical protein